MGPYRSFYTELVLAFTGLRPASARIACVGQPDWSERGRREGG